MCGMIPASPRHADGTARTFGDPSGSHHYGRSAHDAVNTARSALARSHEATPEEIVFIGSGSEVGTLANRGAALPRRDSGDHIIT